MQKLLSLPPHILEKMGFKRPSVSAGSDNTNDNNNNNGEPDEAAIAAAMLKPLIFGEDQDHLPTPQTQTSTATIDATTEISTAPAIATETESSSPSRTTTATVTTSPPPSTTSAASRASPSELFSLCHPSGPQFFVRDNFLGRQTALKVLRAVKTLHQKHHVLRPANMGRGIQRVSSFFSRRCLFALVFQLKLVFCLTMLCGLSSACN